MVNMGNDKAFELYQVEENFFVVDLSDIQYPLLDVVHFDIVERSTNHKSIVSNKDTVHWKFEVHLFATADAGRTLGPIKRPWVNDRMKCCAKTGNPLTARTLLFLRSAGSVSLRGTSGAQLEIYHSKVRLGYDRRVDGLSCITCASANTFGRWGLQYFG